MKSNCHNRATWITYIHLDCFGQQVTLTSKKVGSMLLSKMLSTDNCCSGSNTSASINMPITCRIPTPILYSSEPFGTKTLKPKQDKQAKRNVNTFIHPENLQSRAHTSKFWASTNKTYARLHCSEHKMITITKSTTKSNSTKNRCNQDTELKTTLLSRLPLTYLHYINILSHICIDFRVLHNNCNN